MFCCSGSTEGGGVCLGGAGADRAVTRKGKRVVGASWGGEAGGRGAGRLGTSGRSSRTDRDLCGTGGGARGFSKLASWLRGNSGLSGGLIMGALTSGVVVPPAEAALLLLWEAASGECSSNGECGERGEPSCCGIFFQTPSSMLSPRTSL